MMIYKGPKHLTSRKAIAKRKVSYLSDVITCACHNEVMFLGHYPSDKDGNPKSENTKRPRFFVCFHCGVLTKKPNGFPFNHEKEVFAKIIKFVDGKQIHKAKIMYGFEYEETEVTQEK